jgi:hypothetical protein
MVSVIIIIGLILILILFTLYDNCEYFENDDMPKIIWTYWDNITTLPESAKLCMQSWKKYNPDYEIILLTKQNYSKYVNIPHDIVNHQNFNDTKQRFADLVRIYVIAERGGVWLDATILLTEPLHWLFHRPAEYSGFYIEKFTRTTPVIENWFFAAKHNSKFVKLWRDEFSKLANYKTINDYLLSRNNIGVKFHGIDDPWYLTMHVSAQKVLQIDKYPLDRLILRRAEDGPFKYLAQNNWESKIALFKACEDKSLRTNIMKLRNPERKILDPKIDSDLSQSKCQWL